jgi:transposase
MHRGTLIPNTAEVELVCLRSKSGAIEVELRACRPFSPCPSCGGSSTRVHSRYRAPWQGLPVRILLQARRFFCVDERCSRRIYTEHLPGTVAHYARRSCRSSEALSWVNILNYHITMDPGGIGRGSLVTIPWIVVFVRYRSSFVQIFQLHPPEETATAP